MVKPWEQQGCEYCRELWLNGQQPPKLGVNVDRHGFLHRCEKCGAFWEQNERFATEISAEEARANYDFD
jgi:hypothetical protein